MVSSSFTHTPPYYALSSIKCASTIETLSNYQMTCLDAYMDGQSLSISIILYVEFICVLSLYHSLVAYSSLDALFFYSVRIANPPFEVNRFAEDRPNRGKFMTHTLDSLY